MSTGGGGAATNLGIGFQHRVGAMIMAAMLIDFDPLVPFKLDHPDREVEQVRFETDDAVDDIVLVTSRGRIFIQAKRSINLSEANGADFPSVIRQFVGQYLRNSLDEDAYVLATSPKASTRILSDLRKLTIAGRLNALGSEENPLTVSEERTLELTRRQIATAYEELSGQAIGWQQSEEIFRRIHVVSLAVEDGGDQERAFLTLLAQHTTVDPSLVLRDLIVLALDLAGRRSSIDRAGLLAHSGHLIKTLRTAQSDNGPQMVPIGHPHAGWEYILGWWEERLILADVQRFNEAGNRCVRFRDDMVEFAEGAMRWRLERRTATAAGMKRFLREPDGQRLTEGRELLIMESDFAYDPNETIHAKAQAERCRLAFESNPTPLECLRCGRSISDESALQVEIDEDGLPYEVGLVHRVCLRPTYRILGGIENKAFRMLPEFRDFDLKRWFAAIFEGQGLFSGLPEAMRSRVTPISWKPGKANLSTAGWCVAYHLDNGDLYFVRERGQVHRMTKKQAADNASFVNELIRKAAETRDPICISERSKAFGSYSSLIRADPTSITLRVVEAMPRAVTKAILQAHRTCENYYAPLVALIDAETDRPLTVHGCTVLLTDPLRADHYLQNWRITGAVIGAFDSVVIDSDEQFDRFVYTSLSRGTSVVIDPIFAPNHDLIAGFFVNDRTSMLERS